MGNGKSPVALRPSAFARDAAPADVVSPLKGHDTGNAGTGLQAAAAGRPITAKEKRELLKLAARKRKEAAKLREKAEDDAVEAGLAVAKETERQAAFLDAYSKEGSIGTAAAKVGIRSATHYEWLVTNPDYKAAFESVNEMNADALEGEAFRRAFHGWEEPVYQRGELVGTIRRYSDVLLMFLLKGAKPERYRERFDVQNTKEDVKKLSKLLGVTEAETVRMLNAKDVTPTGPSTEAP